MPIKETISNSLITGRLHVSNEVNKTKKLSPICVLEIYSFLIGYSLGSSFGRLHGGFLGMELRASDRQYDSPDNNQH